MEEDDEIEVELSPNQNVIIKFKAVGELQPNGTREVGSGVCNCQRSQLRWGGSCSCASVMSVLIRTCDEGWTTAMAEWSSALESSAAHILSTPADGSMQAAHKHSWQP